MQSSTSNITARCSLSHSDESTAEASISPSFDGSPPGRSGPLGDTLSPGNVTLSESKRYMYQKYVPSSELAREPSMASWVQWNTAKESPAENISNQGGNNTLPDIETNTKIRSALPNSQRNERHVCNNVVESQRDKGENGKPEPYDFGCQTASLKSEKASQTNQPVAAYSTQKYHAEIWGHLFFGRKRNNGGIEWLRGKHFAVYFVPGQSNPNQLRVQGIGSQTAEYDGYKKQGSCKISKKSHSPMDQHLPPRQTSLQGCNGGELIGGSINS
jgi:hypothetical protein